MLPSIDPRDRDRLTQLAAVLREATIEALARRTALARALDEARLEVERLLMIDQHDPSEYRRVVVRAQMILDVWHDTTATAASRQR